MTDDIVTDLRNRAKHCKEDLERDVEAFILRQAADEIERLQVDRDRWRDLAEYLCQTVPFVVVPNEIASRFPDPLAVHGE